MNKRTIGCLALAGLVAIPAVTAGATYEIDTAHTQVLFKVKHLGIATVTGRFGEFSGEFSYDPQKVEASSATATIVASSIDTNVAKRDEHLRSADFFDAATHPELTFRSTKVTDVTEDSFKLHGDLTIRGVTKPVVLDVEVGGVITMPDGKEKAAFTAETEIDREQFGLTWNRSLESGGVLVGKTVKIMLEVEAFKKA